MSQNRVARQAAAFQPGSVVGDYAILGTLGAGGMGRVHSAVHTSTGRRVAIKTVTGRTPAALEYFRHEIATLAALAHPAVVPIHDHGVSFESPWYAMELLEGPTLRSFLGAAERGASSHLVATQAARDRSPLGTSEQQPTQSGIVLRELSVEQLLELCAQIFQALDFVHSRGVVHGDLKPENIFVLPGMRPVLVDFGVAQSFALAREALEFVPRSIGSVAYMAPEQILGNLPDARADLYAMGCVLYECLVGKNPFQRSTIEATALAQLNARAEPPSERVPGIPSALDALLMRLLHKSPGHRPGYASQVLAMLAAQGVPCGTGRHEDKAAPGPLYRADLVGRNEALTLLSARMRQTVAGGGAKIVVRGESGVGKTRFALEAVDLANRQGLSVFCVRCGDGEQALSRRPLAPMRSLLEALNEHYVEAQSSSSERAKSALAFALSLLDAGAGSNQSPSLKASAPGELLGDLAAALLGYCAEHATLLVLDDIDSAEELTRALVQRLASRQLDSAALLLVCTETLGGAQTSAAASFEPLLLSRLTKADVELMVRSTLAVEYASPRLVDYAYERSEGNPFMVGQCLHALLAVGSLVHDRQRGWHLDAARCHDLGASNGARTHSDLFRLRLESLPPPQIELAGVAAVLGRTFQLSVLAAVAAIPEERARDVVLALCRLHIVELGSSGMYRFVHALLRELLYERVPPAQASLLHRRAAFELEKTANQEPALAGTLALHLSQSGQHLKAATCYEIAAAYFVQTHRHEQACSSFEAAVEELERCALTQADELQLLRVAESLGDTALVLRQLAKASKSYTMALARARDQPIDVARLHRKVAAASQQDHDLAIAHLRQAIAVLGEPPREQSAQVAEWLQTHLDLMFVYYWKREPAVVLMLGRKIEHDVLQHGTLEQHANFHFNMAAGLMAQHRYVGGAEEIEHVDRALAYYRASNQQLKVSMASFLRAMLLFCGGDLDGAQEGFETLLATGQKMSSITIQLRSLTYLCLVHRKRCAVEQVRRIAASTLAMAEEHSMPEYQGLALANLSWLEYRDGNTVDCERLARSAHASLASSATKNAFWWAALLPLLAVAVDQGADDEEAKALLSQIAAELLDISQQLMPTPLRSVLEQLAALPRDSEAHRSLGERAVVAASAAALL